MPAAWSALTVPAVAALLALTPIPATATADHAPQAPAGLTVGDQARPLAVEGAPRFGWLPRDADCGETQSAYQIRVRTGGRVVWDSGRTASAEQAYVAGPADLPRGAAYTWTVRTWDRAGRPSPWARPAAFDTGIGDAGWHASWIRRTTSETDDYTLARKGVTLTGAPVVRARAYVAASQQYELRVNGRLADRGGAFSYPGEGYYKAVDVTRLLRAGRANAIGVIDHWYGAGQGRPAGTPGLLVRLVVDHADGTRQTVVSDGTWRVHRGPWTTTKRRNGDGGDYVEHIDATADPVGWDRPGYDASGWSAPQVIGPHPTAPFTHLQAQESALAHTTAHPVTVTRLASGAVVADFGRVVPAVPVIRFRHGTAGHDVAMAAGYRLAADGTVSTSAEDNQETDLSYGYTQRAGDQTFRAFTYEGFRYLQIDDPQVSAADISAVVQHTDVPARATLRTSDPGVDAAFDLMRRSALYGSQEQFLDTPTREKGQFLGDSVDISQATMAGWGERRLTRKAIREFAASQARYWPDGRLNAVYPNGDGKRDIPDYTEMYPGWVWQYYRQSGDTATLRAAYPVMRAVTAYVRRYADPSTGLITKPAGGSGDYQYGIIDWPDRYGYDMGTVARTPVNILGVAALRATAQAARVLGRTGEAGELTSAAGTLTVAINRRLRRADGVYVDGLEADGTRSTHASQIANSYAVTYGVAPAADRTAVARYVASLGMNQSPMTVHTLTAALAGRPADLVTRLTDPATRGYAKILASGGTFTWESWEAGENGDSMSHAWGATPLIDIQNDLLGVTVTGAGASEIRIQPPAAGLTWASGTVPTQRGPVTLSWRRIGNRTRLTADVPVNVRARIQLPGEPARTVGSGRTTIG